SCHSVAKEMAAALGEPEDDTGQMLMNGGFTKEELRSDKVFLKKFLQILVSQPELSRYVYHSEVYPVGIEIIFYGPRRPYRSIFIRETEKGWEVEKEGPLLDVLRSNGVLGLALKLRQLSEADYILSAAGPPESKVYRIGRTSKGEP